MKIIIPASGVGERFKVAGYVESKPLIKVANDKRIIDYVLQSFSTDDQFFIICGEHNFKEIQAYTSTLKYNCVILKIAAAKFGPVDAVQRAYLSAGLDGCISKDDNVIVSYCDYGLDWDYSEFLDYCKFTDADSVIASYTGYHPHLRHVDNVYACSIKLHGTSDVIKVHEKHTTNNKATKSWHAGAYYFKTYDTMKEAFAKLILAEDSSNGEYYVSMAMNHLIKSEKTVQAYEGIEHFYQLGTPRDLEEFKSATKKLEVIRNNDTHEKLENVVFLAAGLGERFYSLGYAQPKPFLPLGDTSIIEESLKTFGDVDNYVAVGSDSHKKFWELSSFRDNHILVPSNKNGAAWSYKQACSNMTGETLIVPCDLICDHVNLDFIYKKHNYDAIIFTAKPPEYAIKNKHSFSWVTHELGSVKSINVKKIDQNVRFDHQEVLIGSFWVSDNKFLIDAINELLSSDKHKVNGEFYLDGAFGILHQYKNIGVVSVENYMSFGTIEEYTESKYWYENGQ